MGSLLEHAESTAKPGKTFGNDQLARTFCVRKLPNRIRNMQKTSKRNGYIMVQVSPASSTSKATKLEQS